MDKATGILAWSADQREEMFGTYVTTALATTSDDGQDTLDALYTVDDFAPEALEEMRRDVDGFYASNRATLCQWTSPGEAGQLFWLNRNGHGSGFWDRAYVGAEVTSEYCKRYRITRTVARSRVRFSTAMERLSAASKVYGASDVYPGDDGRLHV